MPTFGVVRVYSFCLLNGCEKIACDFSLYILITGEVNPSFLLSYKQKFLSIHIFFTFSIRLMSFLIDL